MLELLSFVVLALVAVILLIIVIIMGIKFLYNKKKNLDSKKLIKKIKRVLFLMSFVILINILLIIISQKTTTTPTIVDDFGNEIENSISELESVEINGKKEWISIRGKNKNNPILLFLAGGPGGSQMAAVRHDLAQLEDNFVVVNWDQPGSAKSYNAQKISSITLETYIDDGIALSKYLVDRFNKEKIYLVGESWGSALGIYLVNENPNLFHSFIGTGQMINFKETEIIDYKLALKIAKENNDIKVVKDLEKNGVPPYYGKGVTMKSAIYLNYLTKQMNRNPKISNSGYSTFRDVGSSEYGVLDKINYFRGIINTFNNVYQQLYDIDLRDDIKKLDVPIYFFIGRHDINAPTELVEDYNNILVAPENEIVWFENSGHSPWINESDKFIKEVLNKNSN